MWSSQHPCFSSLPSSRTRASTMPAPVPCLSPGHLCLGAPLTCSPCPGAPTLSSSPPASPGWWVGGYPHFMDEDVKPLCFPHPPSPGPRAAGSVPDCYNHFPALNYPELPSHSSDTNYCKREGLMLALALLSWCWGGTLWPESAIIPSLHPCPHWPVISSHEPIPWKTRLAQTQHITAAKREVKSGTENP